MTETYFNLNGQECVVIKNEDGSVWSGLKSAWVAEGNTPEPWNPEEQ
jgi:hypothetical protein